MRLLNARTFEFHDVYRNPPPYAILSHTWGRDEDEVSYRDMINLTAANRKAWHQKVAPCAMQAIADGYDYIWIDTCCIDKSNAVEHAEAITSMFQWYQKAQVCYVVLLDVPFDDIDPVSQTGKFSESRWFTRGWTLQELLAPKDLQFFNAGWRRLGSREQRAIMVWGITGIKQRYLGNNGAFRTASVATRMYWAARRETKRPEDRAYSLLGVFGVSMAPIYGEGAEQAFQRLQEQILKKLPDDSILAWGICRERCPSLAIDRSPTALLAQSPSDFLFSSDMEAGADDSSPGFSATSTCIVTTTTALFQLRAPVQETEPGFGFFKLNCRLRSSHDGSTQSVGVPIAWNTNGTSESCFRVRHPNLLFFPNKKKGEQEQTVPLTVNSYSVLMQPVAQAGVFSFRWNPADFTLAALSPATAWDGASSAFTFEAGPAIMAMRFSTTALPKKDYTVVIVSPTRELTTDTQCLIMEDAEKPPIDVIVGSQHFHRAIEHQPPDWPLTRAIVICESQDRTLARHTFEVLAEEPDWPPHPAMNVVLDTETDYIKIKREVAAIDKEIEKLFDARRKLTGLMKELEGLRLPARIPDRVQPAQTRSFAPSRPGTDVPMPRTSFQQLTVKDDRDDSGGGGGNICGHWHGVHQPYCALQKEDWRTDWFNAL